jgi:hypothetical protein
MVLMIRRNSVLKEHRELHEDLARPSRAGTGRERNGLGRNCPTSGFAAQSKIKVNGATTSTRQKMSKNHQFRINHKFFNGLIGQIQGLFHVQP